MGQSGVLITFDDGLGPGSITDRDRAAQVFCVLSIPGLSSAHNRETAVPSDRPQAGQKSMQEALGSCGCLFGLVG
jgi:hypothetical protein